MVWGPLIAWYLFLAGASAGTFVAAAYISHKYPESHRIAFVGRIIALVALCIGLVMLMVDAKAGFANPARFFLLLSNPASVMTIGVYVILVYMVVLIAALVIDFNKRAQPKALSIVGCVLAVCLAAYTGFLLGAAVPYPLWSNAALPVLFVISGGSAGLAAVLIAGRIMDAKSISSMHEFDRAGIVLPIVEAFVLFCMLVMVGTGSLSGAESVVSMISGSYAVLFWLGLVVIGLAMPLCLDIYSRKTKTDNAAIAYVSNAGVLVGGFLLRYLIVMAAVVTLAL